METIKTWKIFFWLTPFYFDTSHFLTYAKISTHVSFIDPCHPRQNFMDPRNLCQNFDTRHSRFLFDPRQNFMDPRHPRKISTHPTHAFFFDLHQNFKTHATPATHAKVWPMPPTHRCYPRHPPYLTDSFGITNMPMQDQSKSL